MAAWLFRRRQVRASRQSDVLRHEQAQSLCQEFVDHKAVVQLRSLIPTGTVATGVPRCPCLRGQTTPAIRAAPPNSYSYEPPPLRRAPGPSKPCVSAARQARRRVTPRNPRHLASPIARLPLSPRRPAALGCPAGRGDIGGQRTLHVG